MIQPHPSAPDGSVTTLRCYQPADFPNTAAILCRCVAPIIGFAFALIRRDIGCQVLGREIGTGLIAVIKSTKTTDMAELEQKLIRMREREIAKARAVFSESAEAAAEDKYDCLNLFLNASTDVNDLIRRIEDLFDTRKRGLITLSTIHKAKGLEWDKVFILDPKLMPHRCAKTSSAIKQERHLQYVAVTRAKLDLVYIDSDDWKELPVATPEKPKLAVPVSLPIDVTEYAEKETSGF